MLMVRSPFGLSLRGMKSDERRLRALGYRTAAQRYLGYIVASSAAGLAGILYVFANLLVSPSTLEFSQDGYLVLMVILGGLGSIWGPVLGSVVIVGLPAGDQHLRLPVADSDGRRLHRRGHFHARRYRGAAEGRPPGAAPGRDQGDGACTAERRCSRGQQR